MSRALPILLILTTLLAAVAPGCKGGRSRGPGGPTLPGADSGPPPGGDAGMGDECVSDEDCADMTSDCGTATCENGFCEVGSAAPDGTPCDDESPCTSGDACTAGACIGVEMDCSALDDGVCIVGACNDATGACEAVPAMDGAVCDDGLACTVEDACTGGTCGGTARDCSSLTDVCNVGMCDETRGGCVAAPLADGVGCDDGNSCTTGDICTAGTCAGTTLDCSGLTNQCNTGSCNPATGTCQATPVTDGTACDDFDACTAVDRCSAGVCTGTSPVDCSFLTDQCNTGTCSPTTGTCAAVPVTDGTLCDDGDAVCTPGTDTCSAGVCGGPSVCCGPQDFRINEVHGGDNFGFDYIEIVNRGTCTLDASTISLALRYDCDTSTITYTPPSGTMVAAGGILRVRDTSTSLMSNELYIGTNVCHNPASSGWTAVCQGSCNLSTCSNFVDYVEESATTSRPTSAPTCATFSPSPVSTSGQTSSQSVNRVAFSGSGSAGTRSDWSVGAATR